MPAITDLTWEQIQQACSDPTAISYNATDGIVIRVGKITGDTYANLAASGVVEFMNKLHTICAAAQSTANLNQPAGERLASFPPQSASAPSSGYVTVTQSIVSRIPLNYSTIIGPNT